MIILIIKRNILMPISVQFTKWNYHNTHGSLQRLKTKSISFTTMLTRENMNKIKRNCQFHISIWNSTSVYSGQF